MTDWIKTSERLPEKVGGGKFSDWVVAKEKASKIWHKARVEYSGEPYSPNWFIALVGPCKLSSLSHWRKI